MSSSDGDRSSGSDKSDNPFIRFKQFTDAKVSAALRGILGLPSASSDDKLPNSRWTDYDASPKYRGESDVDQDSPQRATSNRENETTGSSVSSSWGAPYPVHTNLAVDDEGELLDIPFYSPITKALFVRFGQGFPENDDTKTPWRGLRPLYTHDKISDRSFNPFALQNEQISSSALGMIQAMTYNTLNSRAPTFSSHWLHSQHSVLPYILFSPYSPLALISPQRYVKPPRPPHCLNTPEECIWARAFEDLLAARAGLDMAPELRPAPIAVNPIESPRSRLAMNLPFPVDTPNESVNVAQMGMTWINRLEAQGLLDETPFMPHVIAFGRCPQKYAGTMAELNAAPASEQEMYDQFFGKTDETTVEPDGQWRVYLDDLGALLDKAYTGNVVDDMKQAEDTRKAWNKATQSMIGEFERTTQNDESLRRTLLELISAEIRDEKDEEPLQSPDNVKARLVSGCSGAVTRDEKMLRQPTLAWVLGAIEDGEEESQPQHDNGLQKDRQKNVSAERLNETDKASERDLGVQDRSVFTYPTPHTSTSVSTQTEFESNSQRDQGPSPSEIETKEIERPISVSRSTKQWTSPDGTVTKAFVKTQTFRDGRTVTTKKSWTETPAQEDRGRRLEEIKDEEKVHEFTKEKKEKGKGWFWN